MAKRRPIRPPMSSEQMLDYHREAAKERARRGLPTFTREARREEVMGKTEGESRLSRTQRYSQVKRRR